MKRMLWDFDMDARRGKFHVTVPRATAGAAGESNGTSPLWLVLFDLGHIDRRVGRLIDAPQFVWAAEAEQSVAEFSVKRMRDPDPPCGMCGSIEGTAEDEDGLDRCVGCGCH